LKLLFKHTGKSLAGIILLIFSLVLNLAPLESYAQQEPDGEALLLFSYPSVGQVYVNAVFFDNIAYLPLNEVLSMLYIPSERNDSGKGLKGAYPFKNNNWEIDPIKGKITIQGKTEVLPADKYYFGEFDLYVHPEYLFRIFGLDFSINIYSLSMSLSSEYPLPVDERQKRESLRKKLKQQSTDPADAPLLYDRERKLAAPGMLDYNVNMNKNQSGQNLGMLLSAGMELLGGDFQGVFNGSLQQNNLSGAFSNLRWRYVLPGGLRPDDNAALTSISVGQINTSGSLGATRLLGVGLTNNPVIPRFKLDVFVIDGYTEPDSEVELLIGGQLVDFIRADEVGYYRFNAPITFGTIRLGIRIYTPKGEVIVEDRQLQIPFSFVPKGFTTYNIQAGLPELGLDSLGREVVGHMDVAYGLSNAMTIRAGVDHGSFFGPQTTYGFMGLSARVLQQYLVNVDLYPNRYYQATGSVFYANNASLNVQFTEYTPGSQFNFQGQIRDANINFFYPFKILGKFSGIRFSGERFWMSEGGRNSFQTDFNTQIGRVVARINYRGRINREIIFDNGDLPGSNPFSQGLLTSSLTYTLKRLPSIPIFVRGMFIRGQMRYDTDLGSPQSYSILLSQTVFKYGRFTFGYDRDLIQKRGQLQVGLLYDFNALRLSSLFSAKNSGYTAQQSISGSIGLDPIGNFLPSNRDQVTRSGVSVRMFVDSNDNGIYDEGEEIVPAKAIRLDRSGNMLLGSDGILRITQLQSYWKYKLDVDVNALPNPNLAPKLKSFVFVAEPNRFRLIDIPLYQTGLIDGLVLLQKEGQQVAVGGLRLLLEKEGNDGEDKEIIRTFSDGSFYAFGLLPGKYNLSIDPQQLEFMGVEASPAFIDFEVRALAEGDFIENLTFELTDLTLEEAGDMNSGTEGSEEQAPNDKTVDQEEISKEIDKEEIIFDDDMIVLPTFDIEISELRENTVGDEKAAEDILAGILYQEITAKDTEPWYYPVVGSFRTIDEAKRFIFFLSRNHTDFYLIHPTGQGRSNYRVSIQRFTSEKDALRQIKRYQQNINEGAWLLKY
jgi:hypothetical protein